MKLLPALFIALVFSTAAFSQARISVGMSAPHFKAADMNGEDVALSDLRGKVVVITFWTTHCPICHVEFPKLNDVARSFDGKNVVFLSVTTDNEEKVEEYIKRVPLTSRILPNGLGIVLQYSDRDATGRVDIGYPTFFVINPEGKIKYKASGYNKTKSLSSTVNELLSKS